MNNIFVVPLEKIVTRYTEEWYYHIPNMLLAYMDAVGLHGHHVEITGKNPGTTQALASVNDGTCKIFSVVGLKNQQVAASDSFLNFSATNIWKSSQAVILSQLFTNGTIKSGDVLYFTDAWNPIILMCKYMKDLCGIDVTIHAQWHAGWHDDWDILAQRIKNPEWAMFTEKALFHAIDFNYFTTDFYRNMFFSKLGISRSLEYKTIRCGYPLGYLNERYGYVHNATQECALRVYADKENLVVFPHRLAVEKHIDVFDDLALELEKHGIAVDVCQRNGYTKDQYHDVLRRAKVVLSLARQETYGIAQVEGLLAGAVPIMPDRLSYTEMYTPDLLYSSDWADFYFADPRCKNRLLTHIVNVVKSYDTYRENVLPSALAFIQQNYISDDVISGNLVNTLRTLG